MGQVGRLIDTQYSSVPLPGAAKSPLPASAYPLRLRPRDNALSKELQLFGRGPSRGLSPAVGHDGCPAGAGRQIRAGIAHSERCQKACRRGRLHKAHASREPTARHNQTNAAQRLTKHQAGVAEGRGDRGTSKFWQFNQTPRVGTSGSGGLWKPERG